MQILNTPDPACNEYEDAKETARHKRVLIVTELFQHGSQWFWCKEICSF